MKVKRMRRSDGSLSTWSYQLPIAATGHRRPVEDAPPVATGGQSEDDQVLTTSTDVEVARTSGQKAGNVYVQFFVDEARENAGVDPLPNAKNRIGVFSKEMVKHGVDDATIREAIKTVVSRELGVGAFPGVVDQIHRQRGKRSQHKGIHDFMREKGWIE